MAGTISTNAVIGEIYEASYNPEHWPATLQAIAEYTHSSSAAILTQDFELERACGLYVYNIPKKDVAQYSSTPGGDPNFKIMSEHVPFGTAAAIDHVIPDRIQLEALYGREYTDFVTSSDYYYTGGAILFMDDTRLAGLGLQRKRSMGVWTKSGINKLNILIPHLQRTITIQREFIRLQTREQALRHGLDRLVMGVILFDEEQQPIYLNPAAESILKYHPAIDMHHRRIYAHDTKDTRKIYEALRFACMKHAGESHESSTSIGIRHPDCEMTLPVLISSLQGILHGFETGGQLAHAMMCFSDPDRPHPIEACKLAEAYGLTQAEARVAISIANGITPCKIASMHHVTINTVRSQIKAIYRKLGITQQSDLVKTILTGPFSNSMWHSKPPGSI